MWCLGLRDEGGAVELLLLCGWFTCIFWTAATGCVGRLVRGLSPVVSLVYRTLIASRYLDLSGHILPP